MSGTNTIAPSGQTDPFAPSTRQKEAQERVAAQRAAIQKSGWGTGQKQTVELKSGQFHGGTNEARPEINYSKVQTGDNIQWSNQTREATNQEPKPPVNVDFPTMHLDAGDLDGLLGIASMLFDGAKTVAKNTATFGATQITAAATQIGSEFNLSALMGISTQTEKAQQNAPNILSTPKQQREMLMTGTVHQSHEAQQKLSHIRGKLGEIFARQQRAQQMREATNDEMNEALRTLKSSKEVQNEYDASKVVGNIHRLTESEMVDVRAARMRIVRRQKAQEQASVAPKGKSTGNRSHLGKGQKTETVGSSKNANVGQ